MQNYNFIFYIKLEENMSHEKVKTYQLHTTE
jgi:hypothetical protein